MKTRIKTLITVLVITILLISTAMNVGVSASRIPELITDSLDYYHVEYHLDTDVMYTMSREDKFIDMPDNLLFYYQYYPAKSRSQIHRVNFLPDNTTAKEVFEQYYEWKWSNTNTEQNINDLLHDENIPAVIVEIQEIQLAYKGYKTSWIQYISESEDPNEQYGMTFRSVKIIDVLRNPKNDENLVAGEYLWLKESYYYNSRNDTINLEYGIYQKPLQNDRDRYLIFLDDLYSFDLNTYNDTSLPNVYLYKEDRNQLPAYSFDERYFWKIDDTVVNQKTYKLFDLGFYADYREIQYGYYDKVMSHFGLLEGQDNTVQDDTEQTDPPPTSGPNLAAIFVSIAVLLALGALTYTVNETVKKNKQKNT